MSIRKTCAVCFFEFNPPFKKPCRDCNPSVKDGSEQFIPKLTLLELTKVLEYNGPVFVRLGTPITDTYSKTKILWATDDFVGVTTNEHESR